MSKARSSMSLICLSFRADCPSDFSTELFMTQCVESCHSVSENFHGGQHTVKGSVHGFLGATCSTFEMQY